jgi:sugar lactone lactonase YvrE
MKKSVGWTVSAIMGMTLLAISAAGQTVAEGRTSPEWRGGHSGAGSIVVGNVTAFATLPEMISTSTNLALGHPEGLCADSSGNVYADTFEQPIGGPGGTYVQNFVYQFSPKGNLVSATPVKTGVVPLGCIVSGNSLYFNDVYNGDEYQYTLPLTASSQPTKVFHICGGFTGKPGPLCAMNANYPGPDGNIYISDNGAALFGDFIGRIWELNPATGNSSIFLDSSTGATAIAVANLATADYVPTGSTLPYSANGIAFSRDGLGLYIANMSTNTIYVQAIKNCFMGTGCEPDGDLVQFSNDPLHFISGPDNMDFDENGNLWIASGQEQHVVALNKEGNVVGVFGAYNGLSSAGAPMGLLQPSGIIYSQGNIYIGNESNQSLLPSSDDINWAGLKEFTISSVSTSLLGHQN